jgi:ribosomal protein L7/L12
MTVKEQIDQAMGTLKAAVDDAGTWAIVQALCAIAQALDEANKLQRPVMEADEIYRYWLKYPEMGQGKVGLIKAARKINNGLGLREARDLIERLFVFFDNEGFEIRK